MIDVANYIVAGDHIIAVPKSMTRNSIDGRMLEINGQLVGRREFIVELTGSNWLSDGAVGLQENAYIFEVERGDSWVTVPPYLLEEEAEAKVTRSAINTRKRIRDKVPLFVDQIAVEGTSAQEMIARAEGHRRDTLERNHQHAVQSTELRSQVQALVTAEQFQRLRAARTRFPRSAMYGIEFWRNQLRHIEQIGGPDIYVPTAPPAARLTIPWLGPDKEMVWVSRQGPRSVRVLYVGNSSVLVKIVGHAILDYDPREFPNGNAWLSPEDLTPSDAMPARRAVIEEPLQRCGNAGK